MTNSQDRIQLGSKFVGPDKPCYIIAEAGINHNGSMINAKALIDAAATAGCDAVKFQKREVELVYGRSPFPAGYLDQEREHPLSDVQTQRGQKEALEFNILEHAELKVYAEARGLDYSLSCWDESSLRAAVWLDLSWIKVASACIMDDELMQHHLDTDKTLVISTGMSTPEDVEKILEKTRYQDKILLHCCSAYPSPPEELNLRCIPEMQESPGLIVGYSGHEVGYAPTLMAHALGASVIERHITLDKSMYGSDQAASLDPQEFADMVSALRSNEKALGDGVKRVTKSEIPIKAKLRGDK